MLGMSEKQLSQIIERECTSFPKPSKLEEILKRVATAVAIAIARNNASIEKDLRNQLGRPSFTV